MDETLQRFLKQHAGDGTVWFLLPGGMVSGKLNSLDSEMPETVTLREAFVYWGHKVADVDVTTIRMSQVSAWGETLRTFLDEDFYEG